MLGALVDLELAEHLAAQSVVGKHAFDGLLHYPLGNPFLQSLEGFHLHSPGTTGVTAVQLLLGLTAGDLDLLGVHNDDKITGVQMGGEAGVVLAAEHGCHFSGQTAEGLILSVHHVPLAVDRINRGERGLVHRAGMPVRLCPA